MSIKCVILGKSDVGKTCIAQRLMGLSFSEQPSITISASYMCKTFVIDGNEVLVNIWDTAGQERYASLAPIFYRNAGMITIVYDITDYESFIRAQQIFKQVEQTCQDKKCFLLIGNKSDLKLNRKVQFEEGAHFAGKHQPLFFETSSKENSNIDLAFSELVKLTVIEEQAKKLKTANNSESEERVQKVEISMCQQRKTKCC